MLQTKLTIKISDIHHVLSPSCPLYYGIPSSAAGEMHLPSIYLPDGDTEENWRFPGTNKSTKYREGKLLYSSTLLMKKDNVVKMFLLLINRILKGSYGSSSIFPNF